MKFEDKVLISIISVGLAVFAWLSVKYKPYRTYRITGSNTTIECRDMEETSKGNFHLYNCSDNNEYYAQSTVEVLGE